MTWVQVIAIGPQLVWVVDPIKPGIIHDMHHISDHPQSTRSTYGFHEYLSQDVCSFSMMQANPLRILYMLSVALQLPLADWKSIFFLENHRVDSAGNRGVKCPRVYISWSATSLHDPLNPVLVQNLSGVTTILKSAVVAYALTT